MDRSGRSSTRTDGRDPKGVGQHEHVRSRYGVFARHYDRSFRRYTEHSTRLLLDAVGDLDAPRRILDACCGTGVVTAAIAAKFPSADVIGVDLSPDMLAKAHRRLLGFAPRVRLVEAPAEHLPVESGSIDLLVCANALHLVPEPGQALREFSRVLSAGGRLVLLDWTLDSAAMRVLVAWLNATQRTRRRVYRAVSLRRALEGAGLRVERLDPVRIPPAWGLMLARATKPAI